MENYELNISTPPKRLNGYFPKGHRPFNKGIPMKEWMDGRKIRKVLKCLDIGRKLGNGKYLAGHNKRECISIKDGKLTAYNSITEAAKILRAKGIKINARNINAVCNCKHVKNGKYSYIRKRAGGFRWFFANDVEKYKDLIC